MRVVKSIAELRKAKSELILQRNRKNVGFVPTMVICVSNDFFSLHFVDLIDEKGYLHEGHMSLMKMAKQECGIVVSSIFVNPKQFAPHEDLSRYPRNLERDFSMMEKEGVDITFVPEPHEMYPKHFSTSVDIEGIEKWTREGASRPAFFKGVLTVVSKLFNIVQPDVSYFGQKDAVQCIAVKRMVKDLNFPIDVVIAPTVRESDGLAMSSRNSYLSPEERKIATILYKSLSSSKSLLLQTSDMRILLENAKNILKQEPTVKLDYFNLVDLETGKDLAFADSNETKTIAEPTPEMLMSAAIWVGKTRLIDNVILTQIVK